MSHICFSYTSQFDNFTIPKLQGVYITYISHISYISSPISHSDMH